MFNLNRYVRWQEWLDNNTEHETMGIVHDPHYTVHRSSMRGSDIPPIDGLPPTNDYGID